MSTDVKWFLGTLLLVALPFWAVTAQQTASLQAAIATQSESLREDIRRLDDRLRAVELSLAQLDVDLSPTGGAPVQAAASPCTPA